VFIVAIDPLRYFIRKVLFRTPGSLMQRLVYALDLKDDPALIADYEAWHRADKIWPSVVASLKDSGLEELEIYRTGNRLVLIIEAPDDYSPEAKARADAASTDVQAWEQLMWVFQQPLPWAAPGQKWIAMPRIFALTEVIRARHS
jgi:L-rhamnose mutarotase